MTISSFCRDCRGVTAIEFGLVAPSFFTLLYAFVEIGRALFSYNQLSYAVYEASRYAIVHGSDSSAPAENAAITYQVEKAASLLNTSAIEVTTSWTPDNAPGSEVTVSATYHYQPIINLIDFASFDMTSSIGMTISR